MLGVQPPSTYVVSHTLHQGMLQPDPQNLPADQARPTDTITQYTPMRPSEWEATGPLQPFTYPLTCYPHPDCSYPYLHSSPSGLATSSRSMSHLVLCLPTVGACPDQES